MVVRRLAQQTANVPAVACVYTVPEHATLIREPLQCSWTAAEAVQAIAGERLPFALTGAWAGGGAVVGSDPLEVVRPGDLRGGDPFAVLDRLPRVDGAETAPGTAVGGGWFGWLGYRLAAAVERVPLTPVRPVPMPELQLAYYDNVLRLDPDGRWWFEALATVGRGADLQERLSALRRRLSTTAATVRRVAPEPFVLDARAAARHVDAVAECRRRIAAGEIFQANLCLRLDSTWDGGAAALSATALERISPPYAAMFDTPDGSVASLSPELFLRRRGDQVLTAPIKGTIARTGDPDADATALERLRGSAKDAAEHVMIVDLMRNDIGRVCEYGSVVAPRLPTAEAHPGLWHLVSRVRGSLRPGTSNAALLRATFPPGSVTGAPKVQSLRVIAELERTAREVYTGSIGYSSPIAGVELNVAIRTLELRDGRLWIGAGGGIVADSDPQAELDEAIAKARPIAAAVGAKVVISGNGDAGRGLVARHLTVAV
jgi:para-aminobenzoate synthetase / 4-amino-4-deoxychorismate lyase